jgi:hypothetical protein
LRVKTSDKPDKDDRVGSEHPVRWASDEVTELGRPKRRVRSVVPVSLAWLLGLAIAATIGIYAFVNHADVSSIPRFHVGNLAEVLP